MAPNLCRPTCAIALLCLLLGLGGARSARAQFSGVWGPKTAGSGTSINLFATWEGGEAGGFEVDLPAGWELRRALVLRRGLQDLVVQVHREEGPANRYRVTGPQALQGPHELVLQVETGDAPGRAAWTVTPLRPGEDGPVLREAEGISGRIRLVGALPETDNHALSFAAEGGGPLLLRHTALPDLGTRAAFTVEFWMKTVGLDEVVLSTWDGDEEAAYPLEFMVGRNGRLLFYRGQPGQHQSMMTRQPVADGQWHHVAVTNDPESGWTRLYLDGAAADSLLSPALPAIDLHLPVAVGGRVPVGEQAHGRPFTGALDELRTWSRARRPELLRRTMWQPLPPGREYVVLGFEEEVPEALVVRAAPRAVRTASDLGFHEPIRDLQANLEEEVVQLFWTAPGRRTEVFVVERSVDGGAFQVIGRLPADEATLSEGASFAFTDPSPAGQVLYYRVRQRFSDGTERLSSTIKVGRGERRQPPKTTLVGNFPNPFNLTTVIGYETYERQPVNLSVWDLSGQLVALLLDEEQDAGYHEVSFEAVDLPSGTYFVRLQTPSGTTSRKMILMK